MKHKGLPALKRWVITRQNYTHPPKKTRWQSKIHFLISNTDIYKYTSSNGWNFPLSFVSFQGRKPNIWSKSNLTMNIIILQSKNPMTPSKLPYIYIFALSDPPKIGNLMTPGSWWVDNLKSNDIPTNPFNSSEQQIIWCWIVFIATFHPLKNKHVVYHIPSIWYIYLDLL